MVIYEVNIEIPNDIKEDYITWLEPHIKDMVSFDGFIEAKLFEKSNIIPNGEHIRIVVHYYLESEEALKNYLEQQATKMRSDGNTKFPQQKITRRALRLKKAY